MTRSIMFAIALIALGVAPALSQEAGSARRGLAVVDQWCKTCHSIEGKETNPDRAPTFAEISRRDGRNAAYFRKFLQKDHFPMTTYRLFDHEKQDVVAFMLWLQTD